jgi:stringent starvation protein B
MIGNADNQGSSTRPYLVRALHEWCTDNGFTPYLAVYVDSSVQVPMEHVKNNEIVLNVGFEATSGLKLGNEVVEFRARFGGVSRDIVVPMDHVVAIYARENGQGMAFPVPTAAAAAAALAQVPAAPAPTSAETASAAAPRGLRLATGSAAGSAAFDADPNGGAAAVPAKPAIKTAPAAAQKAAPSPAATPAPALTLAESTATPGPPDADPEPTPPTSGRPSLKRVK